MSIEILNMDCMEYMKGCKDKQFDLAICDPEYGISYEDGGQYFKKFQGKKWDSKAPDNNYFDELFRVSKHQIIWGMNYFKLPPCRCFLCWYKTSELKDRTFSECELAWTSFDEPARQYALKPFQRNGTRIHPTQKPVALYKWLLTKYAKAGDKILDTHLGSGSIAIACHDYGFDLVGTEIDADYYQAALKRFTAHKSQTKLFTEKIAS